MKSQNQEWESDSSAPSAESNNNTSANVNNVPHHNTSDVTGAANGRSRQDRGDRAFGGYRPPFKRVSEKEKELAEREKALAEMERKMQEILKSVTGGSKGEQEEPSPDDNTPIVSGKESKSDRTSSSKKSETKSSSGSSASKQKPSESSLEEQDLSNNGEKHMKNSSTIKNGSESNVSNMKKPAKKSSSSSKSNITPPLSPSFNNDNNSNAPMKKTATAPKKTVLSDEGKTLGQNDNNNNNNNNNNSNNNTKLPSTKSASSKSNISNKDNTISSTTANKNSKPPSRPSQKFDTKTDEASIKKSKSQSQQQQQQQQNNDNNNKNKSKKFMSKTGGRMHSDSIEENYVTKNNSGSSSNNYSSYGGGSNSSSSSSSSSQKKAPIPEPPHVPSKETATRLFSLLSGYASTAEPSSEHLDSARSPTLSLDQGAELLLSRTATRPLPFAVKKEEETPKKTDVRMKLHGIPSEDYRILYREIKEMEVEFAQHLAQGVISRRKVATHTAKMRESYANLIVLSPLYSVAKNVVHKLWMSFYKPIEALIKDSKEAFVRKVAVTEDWKTRMALAIEEATLHLQDLVDRMKAKYLPVLPSGAEGASVRATMSALYICLGDLSRYSLQYITEKADSSDWSVCRHFYEQALAMKPGSGQAHNQLAVLALKQGSYPEAVYQYTRSMCALDPFPARENLLALYEKNRVAYQSMSHDDFTRVRVGLGEGALFDMHWLKLQGMLDTRISLEQFEAVMIHTMDSFQTMMDLGKVTNEFILKSLVMGIYCCERGGDISKESEKVSTPTFNACMVLYEVFGLVVRATSSSLARLEYLEPTSLFCLWLLAHPWLARLQDERCVFFLTGLAQLVNGVTHSTKLNVSREVDPSILMIDGFKPVASLPSLLSAPSSSSSSSSSSSTSFSSSKPSSSARSAASSSSSRSSVSEISTESAFITTTTPTISIHNTTLATTSSVSSLPTPSSSLVTTNHSISSTNSSLTTTTAITSTAITSTTLSTPLPSIAAMVSPVLAPITSFDADDLTSFLSAGYTPPPPPVPSISPTFLAATTTAKTSPTSTSTVHTATTTTTSSFSTVQSSFSSTSLSSSLPSSSISSSTPCDLSLSSSPVTSNLQSLPWLLSTVRSAGQLLVFHSQTGRYSAFATPKQAILEEEKAELLARIAERSAKIAKAQQDKSGGKKKKKKSKAVRAATRALKAKQINAEDPDSFGLVDEVDVDAESKTVLPEAVSEAKTDTLSPELGDEDGEEGDDSSSDEEEKIPALPKNYRPLLVLDAPNICMRHGNHKTFSTLGLQITIQFYRKHGYKRILAFLPDFYLDYNYVGDQVRKAKAGFDVSKTKMPDNISLLLSLRDEGLLVATPSQDYDDTYCIEYALKHQAYIVSNDKYRDYTQVLPQEEQHQMRAWFRQHLITYTFVGDEFLTIKDPLNATQNQPISDSSTPTTTSSSSSGTSTKAATGPASSSDRRSSIPNVQAMPVITDSVPQVTIAVRPDPDK